MNVQFQCPTHPAQPPIGSLQVHADDGSGEPNCGQTCGPFEGHPSVPTPVNAPVTCQRKGCLG